MRVEVHDQFFVWVKVVLWVWHRVILDLVLDTITDALQGVKAKGEHGIEP